MVSAVTRPYRPRFGILQPLRERWETARERAARELPNDWPGKAGLLGLHCDEYTIDALNDAINEYAAQKAAKAAAEAPSPFMQKWLDEIRSYLRRYETARSKLIAARKKIRNMPRRTVEMLQITGKLPLDWDTLEFEAIDLSAPLPDFASPEEAKRFADQMLTPTMFIEGRAQQCSDVLLYVSYSSGDHALDMAFALHNGMKLLTARIEQLEARLDQALDKPKTRSHNNSKRKTNVVISEQRTRQ